MTIIYIVGDKFMGFAKNEKVYTYSEFIEISYLLNLKNQISQIMLGQGLTPIEIQTIAIIAKSNAISIKDINRLMPASMELTHKYKRENSMISFPTKQAGEQTYLSQLLINDDCAEMSDHTTGQHIQGMVLIEAARQMMLAVGEKYILADEDRGKSYCALLQVDTDFKQFAFPIAITIRHKIQLLAKNNKGRYQAKTVTEFLQNNEVISTVSISYIFNNKQRLLARESGMAKEALSKHFATLNPVVALAKSA